MSSLSEVSESPMPLLFRPNIDVKHANTPTLLFLDVSAVQEILFSSCADFSLFTLVFPCKLVSEMFLLTPTLLDLLIADDEAFFGFVPHTAGGTEHIFIELP
jgi:hypothetical protein